MVNLPINIWSDSKSDETIVKPIWSETSSLENITKPIWRPVSGNGEATQSNNALIDTQSGFSLTTQLGIALQINTGTYTKLATNIWVESDGE